MSGAIEKITEYGSISCGVVKGNKNVAMLF